MKITVCIADYGGCGYYRCVVPYRALQALGHDVTFSDYAPKPGSEMPDVLSVQRVVSPRLVDELRYLRETYPAMRIIHETDDNFSALLPTNPSYPTQRPGTSEHKAMEAAMRLADACVVSTLPLATECRRYNERQFVCPNAFDDAIVDRWLPRAFPLEPKVPNQVRIAWAGSATHKADLEMIRKPLESVMRLHPQVRLVLAGADYRDAFSRDLWPRMEFAGATVATRTYTAADVASPSLPSVRYYRLLDSLDADIGIAPIEQTLFNDCKSDLKLMEFGLMGIPAVASRFGPYRRYMDDAPEKVALFATGDREWEQSLSELVEKPGLRAALAAANARFVDRSHRISVKVERWLAVLASFAPRPVAADVPVIHNRPADRVRARRPRHLEKLTNPNPKFEEEDP